MSVKFAAVGLDHKALLRPKEVNLHDFSPDVQLEIRERGRKAARDDQWQQEGLEIASQVTGVRLAPVDEDRTQVATAAAPTSGQDGVDRRRVEHTALRRALHRSVSGVSR